MQSAGEELSRQRKQKGKDCPCGQGCEVSGNRSKASTASVPSGREETWLGTNVGRDQRGGLRGRGRGVGWTLHEVEGVKQLLGKI